MVEVDIKCHKWNILSRSLFFWTFSLIFHSVAAWEILKNSNSFHALSFSDNPEDFNSHKTYFSLPMGLYSIKDKKTSDKGSRSNWVDKDTRRKLGLCIDAFIEKELSMHEWDCIWEVNKSENCQKLRWVTQTSWISWLLKANSKSSFVQYK